MTKACLPGYELLAEVGNVVGAEQILADLISEKRVVFAWDPYNGKEPLKRIPAKQWLMVGAEKFIAEGKARPYPLATRTVTLLLQKQPLKKRKSVGSNKGGRPPKGDWEAIEDALAARIERDGEPEPRNIDGWQRQADVYRWVADLLVREGVDVSETTIKTHVGKMLKRMVRNSVD